MGMKDILLQSPEALLRSFVLLGGAYVGLVTFLRVSGKRTLSKMNAFDLVVTVALGSTLATISLSKDVVLVQGLLVLAMFIGLQFAVAWLSVRSRNVRKLVKSEPALLFHRGDFLEEALCRERVTRDEVLAAVRSEGYADLAAVLAVVLEIDGTFSVVGDQPDIRNLSIKNVKGFPVT